MTISLTNATVSASAAPGSLIGIFNQPVVLDPMVARWFTLNGDVNLVVRWDGAPAPGQYVVGVKAFTEGAEFTITVTP